MSQAVPIALIIQILTQCNYDVADRAEKVICQSPKALAVLTTACAASGVAVSEGGTAAAIGLGLTSTGGGAPVGVPATLAGTGTALIGAIGVKKFCFAAVSQVTNGIGNQLSGMDPNPTTVLDYNTAKE